MPTTQAEVNALEVELEAIREALNQNEQEHKRLMDRAKQILTQLKGI